MKKLPKGVRINNEGSLFLDFRYPKFDPPRCREVLSPNGVVLKKNSANIAFAGRYIQSVLAGIAAEKMGGPKFDYAKFFPDSKRLKPGQKRVYGEETIESFIRERIERLRTKGSAKTSMRKFNLFGEEFINEWGAIHYTELTVPMMEELIMKYLSRGLTLRYIKAKFGILKGAMKLAVRRARERGENFANPYNDIDWGEIGPSEKEKLMRKEEVIIPFDFDEIERILRASPNNGFRVMVITGFGLGPRPNELFGLAWEDIDLVKKKLHFTYGKVEEGDTLLKTKTSDRWIDLSEFPHVLAALKEQKDRTFMLKPADCGEIGKRHMVFYQPNGNPYSDSRFFREEWERVLRKAGVVYRPPVQMRHTFATLHRVAGKPDLWIAGIQGHKTTRMLEIHYGSRWPSNAGKMGKNEDEIKLFWEKQHVG